ncbi:MAG TPA: TonB-dependent receptor [Ignavibacteria bacterium]|nr:TonB-dependent receptor [Ignavibacteria bacterium]
MKTKFLFIFIFLFFISSISYSQNNLSGKVLDASTQKPLSGAIVSISDLKISTATDTNGYYLLDNLPEGNFALNIKYTGYKSITERINILGSMKLNFELTESIVEISEIVVTGTNKATELRDNPLSISTIANQSLFNSTSTNIIDALSKTPGISQLTTGTGISKPVIRGLGYNRIITLYNGIRQEGQQWGDEHGIELDEFSIDRVEILKGPGSLVYGSDALAGVINFLTPDPLPRGEIMTNFATNYQTNNNFLRATISNAGNINGFNWLVRGSSKLAGNFQNKYDGKVYNSGFNEWNVNGYLGLNKSWGYSHLNFSFFNQNLGIVEGERDSSGDFVKLVNENGEVIEVPVNQNDLNGYNIDVPKQNIQHLRISNTSNLFFGKTNLEFSFGYQKNIRKEFANPLDENETELYFLLNTYDYDVKYNLPAMNGWLTSFGTNGMYQTNLNEGVEALIPDYNLFDIGAYLITQKNFGRFSLSGGVRFDNRHVNSKGMYFDSEGLTTSTTDSIKFSPFNKNFSSLSGSIGFSYFFDEDFSMKLNIARGFRAPNIAELGSNGVHEGTIRYEIGNDNLKPEHSLQGDLGFFLNTSHVSSELSVFYNSIDNYIFLEKLINTTGQDSIVYPKDPLAVFKFVQGNAYLLGGEFSIDIHPHPLDWLHFENSIAYVLGIQRNQPDSMKYLPFIPAARLRSELKAEINKIGSFINDGYVFVEGDYTFAQNNYFSAFNTETATPSYLLFSAGFGGDIINNNGNTILKYILSVNNIFDVAYQNNMSRLKYAPENLATGREGIYNMGRNISFKVSVPFMFSVKK